MSHWGLPLFLCMLQIGGVFESWMYKLVGAVVRREAEANVIVVDWLGLAHQLYPDAVNHTQNVGVTIATLLNWLQVHTHAHTHKFTKDTYNNL